MNIENFVKYGIKNADLSEVKIWQEAEKQYLDDLIGFNFSNHLFFSEKGLVSFYYDYDEYKKFRRKLKVKLNNDFFNVLCDYYVRLCKENPKTQDDIKKLMKKMWAVLVIFNEIDESPGIANQHIKDRLLEVRNQTHKVYYQIKKKLKKENKPTNFVLFRGKLYKQKL